MFYQARFDEYLLSEFLQFQKNSRIHSDSDALRVAVKYGLQTFNILTGREANLDRNIQIETLVDNMTPDQLEWLKTTLEKKMATSNIRSDRVKIEGWKRFSEEDKKQSQ